MRMGELSGRTGVPIPTIKFYLREGLLSAGERTSPNQARYDDGHERRLKLIRALVDVGGLTIAAARTVLGCLDRTDGEVFEILGKIQYSLMPRRAPEDDDAWRAAETQARDLLERHGWRVRADNPAHPALIEVIAVLHRLGQDDVLGLLDRYAVAAHELAGAEVDLVRKREPLEDRAEGVVIAAVLGDTLLTALRRLAQEDQVARWLSPADAGASDPT